MLASPSSVMEGEDGLGPLEEKEQLTSLSQLMGQQAGTSQGVMQAEGEKMLKDLFKL